MTCESGRAELKSQVPSPGAVLQGLLAFGKLGITVEIFRVLNVFEVLLLYLFVGSEALSLSEA